MKDNYEKEEEEQEELLQAAKVLKHWLNNKLTKKYNFTSNCNKQDRMGLLQEVPDKTVTHKQHTNIG